MFNWFNNLKIRSKLTLAFLVVTGLTLVVGGVALVSQNSAQTTVDELLSVDVQKAELALETSEAMLMARRGEKDYLLRYKDLGFEEARSEYVAQVQEQVATIHKNLAEIKSLEVHADDIALVETMDQATVEYETTFLATASLIEQRGYVDTGLEGQFREKVHAIESAVEARELDRLLIDLLSIRREEKDYLLRGEEKYVMGVHSAVAQFKADVAASDSSQSEKGQLTTLADEYQALFDRLVQADAQIATSIETYREAVHTLEPLLDEIRADALQEQAATQANMERAIQATMIIVIVVSLVAVVVGLLVAFFLSRAIANAVIAVARAAAGIAGGDLKQQVDIESKDELGDMAASFRRMIAYLQAMAVAADRMAQGDLIVDVTPQSEKDTLGKAMLTMKDSLQAMAAGVNSLIEAAVAGKLDARADVTRFSGEYARIVQGVNDTLDAVIGPLNVAAEYVDRISKGDIPAPITDEYKGDFNEIKLNLNTCIEAVNAMIADANMLSAAAVEGKLSARADASRHQGDFRKIIQGVNDTLDAVIGPLNVAAEYVDRLSKGDIPQPIAEEYRGDFNEVKLNLNLCIETLNSLMAEVNRLIEAAVEGRLEARGETDKFSGDYARIVQGVNTTVETLVGHLNAVPTPVVIVDKDFNIRFISKAGADVIGVSQEHLVGQKCYDHFKTGDCRTAKCACARAMSSGRRETSETDAHPGGKDLAIAYTGEPVRDQKGEIIGVLEVVVDQTQVKNALDTQQKANDCLQATVQEYVGYMGEIARGNLTVRLDLDGNGHKTDDPLVVLGEQLNETSASLQRMLGQIREAANNLGSAATEILSATTQQASGASEQSAAISQTTTTVDEVKTIAEQASVRAQEVASSSQRTVDVARSGQTAVQDTIESMREIKERVEGIAENILALSEQTQQIGEIIATVNEIAAQSNMLALNASVEAARAGEHGKGFAVVAMEVRNLAEQSRQATAQVKAILSEIQKATNATVMATEEGTKGVDKGVQLAAQTQEAIQQLAAVINESAQIAQQVVAGGQQQQSGIEQIAQAMQNINQATVQSLSSTRQAEKAAQDLNELAGQLNDTVAQYQL